MKFFLLVISFCCLVASCNFLSDKQKTAARVQAKLDLLDTDRAFSKLSEEKGMKHAFLEFIDSNGVLLRPNHPPIVGADAVDFLIQQNDTTYTLKWEPKDGAVARSGELGYTYGIYALMPTSKDTIIYGTYTNIWRKEAGGKWKFVVDTGNEGIGDTKEEE
jgi:ketosteroid isomerase-like protein